MLLIRFEPRAPLLCEQTMPFKGGERVHPLTHRLRGLVVEQPVQDIAVAFPGATAAPEPPGDILPERHSRVRHTLKMHYTFSLSRALAIASGVYSINVTEIHGGHPNRGSGKT